MIELFKVKDMTKTRIRTKCSSNFVSKSKSETWSTFKILLTKQKRYFVLSFACFFFHFIYQYWLHPLL